MRLLSFSLCLLLCVLSVSSQTPIPTRPDGYGVGSPSSPVVLEAFYDLLCPDSKASWPVIQQVVAYYQQKVYFLFHTFPLPYHTFSFIANQGMHIIAHNNNGNISTILAYASLMFDQQALFYNAPTMNLSTTAVVASMAKIVASANLLSANDFVAGVNDVNLNYETRVSWKYGCSRGQVTGTPTFLVNGIYVSADATWTVDEWKQVIDPLVNDTSITSKTSRNNKHNKRNKNKYPSVFLSDPSCPSGQTYCQYTPTKYECCLPGENCIPNVGCRCLTGAC